MKTYGRSMKSTCSEKDNILDKNENSCRLCLTKDNTMIHIFNEDEIVPIPLKIKYCISLEVSEDDGLPCGICTDCISKLDELYAFKKLCLSADAKLRQFIQDAYLDDNFNKTQSESICWSNDLAIEDFTHINVGKSSNYLPDESFPGKIILEHSDSPDLLRSNSVSKIDDDNVNTLAISPSSSSDEDDNINRVFDNNDYMNSQSISEEVSSQKKTGTPVYKCIPCGDAFHGFKSLLSHKRVCHPEAIKDCNFCKKQFFSKSTLERHLRTHTGERPYKCEFCYKSFNQKEILNRHKLLHSEKSKQMIKCTYCSYSSLDMSILQKHVTCAHNDKKHCLQRFKCSTCGRCFSHRSGLSRHRSSHKGVVHGCPCCNKTFSDRSSLNRHHTNFHMDLTMACTDS